MPAKSPRLRPESFESAKSGSYSATECLGAARKSKHRTAWVVLLLVLASSLSTRQRSEGAPAIDVGEGTRFPRRILAIGVSHHLYAGTLASGAKGLGLPMVVERLAHTLQVPSSQVTVLHESPADPSAITKTLIEKTIVDYLDGSRDQDRILLLFSGHVTELKGRAYLVPFEGEFHDPESHVSLDWLFARLAKCKARQKVLILDVCRIYPSREWKRLGGLPMGAKLDEALRSPPDGVQVWSACIAGQNACESESATGSVFLDQLMAAVGDESGKCVRLGIQRPEDPLPISLLARGDEKTPGVDKATELAVEKLYKRKQTPRLTGVEQPSSLAYDPKVPLPPRLICDRLLGRAALVDTIYRVTRSLEKHAAVQQDVFRGDILSLQRLVPRLQKPLALAELEWREALEELVQVNEARNREKSPQWQANYDFLMARTKSRIASVREYNYLLSDIRTENLPPSDPKKHTGWRLLSQPQLSSRGEMGKESHRLVEEATLLIFTLERDGPDIPWKKLAEQDSILTVGLRWVPIP